MSTVINLRAVIEGGIVALVAGVGLVVVFSLGLLSLQAGSDDSTAVQSGRSSKLAARAMAGVAFLVFAAIIVVGIVVMLNK